MNLPPIVAALRKHKAGVFLIGLQIALTLAIACNLINIVGQHIHRIDRPTGLDENNLFMISQTFVGAPKGNSPASIEKLDSMQLTDLATLRSLPDVQYATPVNSLPLLRTNQMGLVSTKPNQTGGNTVTQFTGGRQMFATLGLKLVAGRQFNDLDVHRHAAGGKLKPAVVIVTRALAHKLFPHGTAVGKPIYLNGNSAPSTIVGVVARMLTSAANGPEATAYDAVLIPARIDSTSTMYTVRAKPGRLQAAMRESRAALFKADPLRIIQSSGRYFATGIHTFAQIRRMGYPFDIFMVQVLSVICIILLLITGIGMAGLTSFWVRQRHKQIGIRRALGARKIDILHYFQIENLIIACAGCVVGVILAFVINLGLMRMFAMHQMPPWYVAIGVAVILAIGQLAVFAPARRASNVPPVVATRNV